MRALAATAVAIFATMSAQVYAQALPCPPAEPDVAYPCQLERWPGPLQHAAPHYPLILLSAGISGTVRTSYRIDSLGHPILATLVVVQSSHELFTMSIRAAMRAWLFSPPRRNGQPVTLRYDELVRFEAGAPPPPVYNVTIDSRDSAGLLVTSIGSTWNVVAFGSTPTVGERTQRAIVLFALREVMRRLQPGPKSMVTVCVALQDENPDRQTLRRLSSATMRAVTRAECPRTYASMAYSSRPEDQAPPGWVDPIGLSVVEVGPWAQNAAKLSIVATQGTGGRRYRCLVERLERRWEKVTCASLESWVS